MSATVNTRIQLKRDTTENWNMSDLVPMPGEVVVYTDYEVKTYEVEEYGKKVTKTVKIPNIKVGTGNAYVQDLAFVDEKTRDILMAHIQDHDIHVTLQEKVFWNNKINVDDAGEQVSGKLKNDTLILNRN